MDEKNIPKHVGIIMDGNGRWAKQRGKKRTAGHKEGAKSVEAILLRAKEMGIEYITLYAFSTENWKRPKEEVETLMKMFKQFLKEERKTLKKNNMSLKVIGRREGLSKDLIKLIDETEEELKENKGLQLNLAVNYGGRIELIDAVNSLIKEGKSEIGEKDIIEKLYNPLLPDPELIIRTSGEYRLSNFLTWQSAYSEIYISDVFWPDFREKEFDEAIDNYLSRERRRIKIKKDRSP